MEVLRLETWAHRDAWSPNPNNDFLLDSLEALEERQNDQPLTDSSGLKPGAWTRLVVVPEHRLGLQGDRCGGSSFSLGLPQEPWLWSRT